MSENGDLSLDEAMTVLEATLAGAREQRIAAAVTIVDAGGHVVCKARMDGGNLVAILVSEDKAYTAAMLGMKSGDLQPAVQPGGDLFGSLGREGTRLVTIGGGFPLRRKGRLLGGLGVSGGSPAEDVAIAESGLAVWRED